MKAAIYDQPGKPEVLYYTEVPDPLLAKGEILIKVEAISIEGGDIGGRRSTVPPYPGYVGGYAASGEILELGDGVTAFEVGQKVSTFAFSGSHSSLRAVPAAQSWAVPRGMDMQLAAAALIGSGTAAQALAQAGLKNGETVLVLGAAGGVGVPTLQLASKLGARVLGTGSNADTLEELRNYGLTDPVLLDGKPIAERVKALLGGAGVDVLIDTVGVADLQDILPSVKDGGRVVILGAFESSKATLSIMYILAHRLVIHGCLLGKALVDEGVYERMATALEQAATGELKVPIDKVFPLSEAAAAHARAEARGKIGRVLMVPDL